MLTEFGLDTLFVYALVIGSIVAMLFVYIRRKKRVK